MNSTLAVNDIRKAFDGLFAIRGISLSIAGSQVTSLIGPNGAGKTTLFNMVSGFQRPDSGHISLNGTRIDGMAPFRVSRLGVGRLFQDVRVFKKLTVVENLIVARYGSERDTLASVLGGQRATRWKPMDNRTEEWLSTLGLLELSSTPAERLSYGQQKLVAFGRLLVRDFNVLLLDEPLSGISSKMEDRILGIVKQLVTQGRMIVVIEHDMGAVREFSDWVYFLSDGKVMAMGSPDSVLGDAEVRRSYLLL